ncbi:putative glycolipid-binding domain-containing protein [Enemella evansiae]|uniref:putative glycolipid-binding domain-containing protein n=1 Tax=Enemella evansiae TaxID=2016499 RepID=UPI000B9683A7|nr:putative glycolipid-binding domain-containing protein [Enemella evansiae]OYO03516.1 hypothetical protein CGZ97_08730 [Enemella evansiae]
MRRRIIWQGEDDPTRLDTATVDIIGTTLTAHGTQRSDGHALAWSLECDDRWVTRRMRVTAYGPRWRRVLDLTHDGAGHWASSTLVEGGPDGPEGVGLRDLDGDVEYADALDCDLGLCPLTNVMPIRRLGLLAGEVPEQTLTMAWIEVPSLRVIPSVQRYASAGPGRVRYESERRDFRSELTVDDQGIVIDYPQLARRL